MFLLPFHRHLTVKFPQVINLIDLVKEMFAANHVKSAAERAALETIREKFRQMILITGYWDYVRLASAIIYY